MTRQIGHDMRFTEEEIYAAVRGAQHAGSNVAVEILPNGTIRLVPVGMAEATQVETKANPQDAKPLREVLKVEDLAKHWNISSASVRSAIAAGKIRHFRVGTLIRIKREEVERIDREGGTEAKETVDEAIPYPPKRVPAPNGVLRKPDAFEVGRRLRQTELKPK